MAALRFTDLQSRLTAFLDVTSLTLDEFQQLVPPFEAAFQAHMAAWRLDGQPRTARRCMVYQHCPFATLEERLFFLLTSLKTSALQGGHGRLVGMGQSKAPQWMHGRLPILLAALRALGDAPGRRASPSAGVPPCAPDGTARRIVRPQDPPEQAACERGKQKDHTGKYVLLVNALLTILFLSATYAGRVHDKPIADATPYPLPAGSGLLQDLGFLAFTLPQVEILMPTKEPRGQELPWEEQLANQALHQRRLRIEHVNSSVQRCRIVKDRIRLWTEGVRDLVMELCCALHHFCVRLTPWQPRI